MMVVHALEQELGKDDGVTVSFQNRWAEPLKGSASATIDGVRNLLAEEADAIIVVTPRQSEIDALLAIADSSRVPFVLVTPDYTAKRMVPQIRYDNANAGYLAADHLIQRGYDQITFFAPYTAWWGDERLEGVQDAIYRNGLKAEHLDAEDYDKAIYAEMNNQEDVAYREAVRLLDSARSRHGHPGWGVVAINDHAAYGFLRAASQRNMVPGVDYGIIAFDDLMMSRTYGLTTLRAPYDQMGVEAGRMVRQVLSGGNMPMELSLQSSVVARKSTLPQTR
jgi:LacI family transcriptional regulator